MLFFPLFNVIFLIILYRIHKMIFYITTAIELLLYVGGLLFIESSIGKNINEFLFYLGLTGAGLIVGFAAFFIAITLNHKHLYVHLDKDN